MPGVNTENEALFLSRLTSIRQKQQKNPFMKCHFRKVLLFELDHLKPFKLANSYESIIKLKVG